MNLPILSSPIRLSVVACVITALTCHGADATPRPPSGPPKVRIIVKENNLATMAGGTGAASPAPAGGAPAKPAAPQKGAGAQKPPAAAPAALTGVEAEKYTHTTKKSLAMTLVDLTPTPMDVTVRTTFLAKDEAGKHEVVVETTQEKKITIQPGKAEAFTTEEVSFTHTGAHRDPPPKQSGGGGKGSKPAASPLIPASGHAYFGYKVEVLQGSDVVGSAASETH